LGTISGGGAAAAAAIVAQHGEAASIGEPPAARDHVPSRVACLELRDLADHTGDLSIGRDALGFVVRGPCASP